MLLGALKVRRRRNYSALKSRRAGPKTHVHLLNRPLCSRYVQRMDRKLQTVVSLLMMYDNHHVVSFTSRCWLFDFGAVSCQALSLFRV